jgi:hypothetical protein
MNPQISRNFIRFIVLVLLQVLIFKRLNLGWNQFNYIHILIYPLFLFLLPINISKSRLLLLAFILGICIDAFYDSPGVHASAAVFTAFFRPLVLNQLEPRGGYKVNAVPTKASFGNNWFFRYVSILLFIHSLFYFSVEAFTFDLAFQVFLKTIFGSITSFIMVGLYVFIFDPKV